MSSQFLIAVLNGTFFFPTVKLQQHILNSLRKSWITHALVNMYKLCFVCFLTRQFQKIIFHNLVYSLPFIRILFAFIFYTLYYRCNHYDNMEYRLYTHLIQFGMLHRQLYRGCTDPDVCFVSHRWSLATIDKCVWVGCSRYSIPSPVRWSRLRPVFFPVSLMLE